MLALLVFFALFGIFLTQYLPLWMNDNEAQFTSSVATSFAQYKADVDSQYTLDGPPVLGTPFTTSSQSVPLIAQPTEGSLRFLSQACPAGFSLKTGQPVNTAFCVFENQSMSIGPGGSGPYYLSVPTGVLSMQLPNRYYSVEMFQYEADGVVQVQSGIQQFMAFAPPFNVTRLAGNTTVASSFLQLYGNSTTVVAQGSEEVYSHLRYSEYLSSNGNKASATFTYTFEIGTQYPCAWYRFLSTQLNGSGVPSTQYSLTSTPTSYSCFNPSGGTTILTLALTSVNYATLFYAGVQVNIGVGGT